MSETYARYESLSDVYAPMVKCLDCGDAVIDVGAHDKFHRTLDGHAQAFARTRTDLIAAKIDIRPLPVGGSDTPADQPEQEGE